MDLRVFHLHIQHLTVTLMKSNSALCDKNYELCILKLK